MTIIKKTMMHMIKDDNDDSFFSHLVEVLLLFPLQQLHAIKESTNVVAVRHPSEVQILSQHVHDKAETQDAHNLKAQVNEKD